MSVTQIQETYDLKNKIRIYENFFLEKDIDILKSAATLEYKPNWKANPKKNYDYGHWNKLVLGNEFETDDPMYDAFNELNYDDPLQIALIPLWETIQKKIGSRRARRIYFNAYTYGTEGYIHLDQRDLNQNLFSSNSITAQETILCYSNVNWEPDWAGETLFFAPKSEDTIVAASLPKFNRVVHFSGSVPHVARSVSRICPVARTVLVFKTAIDYFNEDAAIKYIHAKTSGIPHSGRTFFDHLIGTKRILEQRFSQEIYLAGLYHSAYDTEFFKADLNLDRETVRNLIGKKSENLVHLFCTLRPRKEMILTSSQISEVERYHLAAIEYANLLEQKEHSNADYMTSLSNILQKEGKSDFRDFRVHSQ